MTNVAYGIAMPAVRGVLARPPLLPPLDQVTGATVRGAWSLARPMFARFRAQSRGRVRDTVTSGELSVEKPTEASAFLGANAGAVVSLFDHSGNNRTLTNATAAQQPAFSANVGATGKAGCVFDAVDDRLAGAALSNFFSASSFYVVAVVRFNALTLDSASRYGNQCVWGDAQGWVSVTGRVGAIDTVRSTTSVDFTYVEGASAAAGITMVHEAWMSGGILYSRRDGVTAFSAPSANIGSISNAFVLGKAAAINAASNAAIMEVAAMSAVPAQADAVVANMKAYYGIV